eukprot:COSAG04_NODE_738_length_10699_cov_72.861604_13_plen_161_part_00
MKVVCREGRFGCDWVHVDDIAACVAATLRTDGSADRNRVVHCAEGFAYQQDLAACAHPPAALSTLVSTPARPDLGPVQGGGDGPWRHTTFPGAAESATGDRLVRGNTRGGHAGERGEGALGEGRCPLKRLLRNSVLLDKVAPCGRPRLTPRAALAAAAAR